MAQKSRAKVVNELNNIAINLLDAMGSSLEKDKRPTIELLDTQSRGAAYNNETQTIYIDLVAYNLCENFGEYSETALAFVIGHELGHFYYNSHCGKEMGFVDGSKRMMDYMYAKATGDSSPELMADFFGVMSAHLAGYPVLYILDGIIEAFDRKYPAMSTGYPSVEIRNKVNNIFRKKSTELVRINELALLLQLIKHYDIAASCHQQILKDFNNPESYNNLALSYLEEALQLYDSQINREIPNSQTWRLAFGFELDPNFRLFSPYTRPVSTEVKNPKADIKNLVKKAKETLNLALQLNSNYATAYLNQAWAELLLASLAAQEPDNNIAVNEHLTQCSALAKLTIDLSKHNRQVITFASAELCALLAKAKRIGLEAATTDLEKMAVKAPEPINKLAEMNLAILNNQLNFSEAEVLYTRGRSAEKKVVLLSKCPTVVKEKVVTSLSLPNNFKVEIKEVSCSIGDFIQYKMNDQITFEKSKRETTLITSDQPISIGTRIKEIKAVFGDSINIISASNGFYIVYELNKIILRFNNQEELVEWWRYYEG